MASKKTIAMVTGIFVIGVLLISLGSAAFWKCFGDGEVQNLCRQPRTCGSDLCKVCMSTYDEINDCYYDTNPNRCGSQSDCTLIGGNTTVDDRDPVIEITNIQNDSVVSDRRVLFEISLDERAGIYYMDANRPGRWTRVCYDCDAGYPAYSREISLRDGENYLIFKAVDLADNEGYTSVKFIVDSKAPRIYRTYPYRGFADGTFEVQFREDNPKNLTLYYGNESSDVDLEKCHEERGKTYCETSVNLSKYHGQEVEYYFELEDIAGSKDSSRPASVDVDVKPPVLNNPNDFFEIGEGRYSRYVYFNFNVTEENFENIVYVDNNDLRSRPRRLCSRLYDDGTCERRSSFRRGNYSLSIQISDEAGQSIAVPAEFEIDY